MTNFTKNLMVAAAALVMAGVASAQTLKADIPFAFRVGDKLMNPGSYIVANTMSGSGTVVFRLLNLSTHDGALTMPNVRRDPAKEWKADGKARLAFECGESRCRLSQIWGGGGSSVAYGISRPKSHNDGTIRVAVIRATPVKAE